MQVDILINAPAFFSSIHTDNFQDQMKRELAYREEMVQQLQIVSCSPPLKPVKTYPFLLLVSIDKFFHFCFWSRADVQLLSLYIAIFESAVFSAGLKSNYQEIYLHTVIRCVFTFLLNGTTFHVLTPQRDVHLQWEAGKLAYPVTIKELNILHSMLKMHPLALVPKDEITPLPKGHCVAQI